MQHNGARIGGFKGIKAGEQVEMVITEALAIAVEAARK